MALSHELPIYKQAYKLLDLSLDLTRNFPRDFKRLMGEKLRSECVEITVLIFRANVATDKESHIQKLRERVQVAELIVRMSKDKKWIGTEKFAAAVALTQSIGKQATGWSKFARASSAV